MSLTMNIPEYFFYMVGIIAILSLMIKIGDVVSVRNAKKHTAGLQLQIDEINAKLK